MGSWYAGTLLGKEVWILYPAIVHIVHENLILSHKDFHKGLRMNQRAFKPDSLSSEKEKLKMVEETPKIPLRPAGPKAADQLGILVLDRSASMSLDDAVKGKTKAKAVEEAALELIAKLKKSGRARDFSLSLLAFNESVETRLDVTEVLKIPLEGLLIDLTPDGQTAIGDALNSAGKIARDFLQAPGEFPRSVVVMLMSDGENVVGEDPVAVSESIKTEFGNKCTICCVFYGDDNDLGVGTLRTIASPSNKEGKSNFKTTKDSSQLRDFFLDSFMGERVI